MFLTPEKRINDFWGNRQPIERTNRREVEGERGREKKNKERDREGERETSEIMLTHDSRPKYKNSLLAS